MKKKLNDSHEKLEKNVNLAVKVEKDSMKDSQKWCGFCEVHQVRNDHLIHGENQRGKKVHRSYKSKTGPTRYMTKMETKVQDQETHWLVDCQVLQ